MVLVTGDSATFFAAVLAFGGGTRGGLCGGGTFAAAAAALDHVTGLHGEGGEQEGGEELCSKTGLTRDTIRFYEKQGIIHVGRRDRRENNYKEYGQDALSRLIMLKRLKNFGFTLVEIRDILDQMESHDATCGTVSSQLQDNVARVEAKIKELEETRRMMLEGLSRCGSSCQPETLLQACATLGENAGGMSRPGGC